MIDAELSEQFIKLEKLIMNGGYLCLSYMNGKNSGFESTSFSKDEISFKYYYHDVMVDLLNQAGLTVLETCKEDYVEQDCSITTDTFIYAQKILHKSPLAKNGYL